MPSKSWPFTLCQAGKLSNLFVEMILTYSYAYILSICFAYINRWCAIIVMYKGFISLCLTDDVEQGAVCMFTVRCNAIYLCVFTRYEDKWHSANWSHSG